MQWTLFFYFQKIVRTFDATIFTLRIEISKFTLY